MKKNSVVAWFLAVVFSGVVSVRASENDYYIKAEAKHVIDQIVDAHGGFQRLTRMERAKVVMTVNFDTTSLTATLYQTRNRVRRDIKEHSAVEIYDGTNGFLKSNGRVLPANSNKVAEMKKMLEGGITQQYLLGLTNRNNKVTYTGKRAFKGQEMHCILSQSSTNVSAAEYFDVKNFQLRFSEKVKAGKSELTEIEETRKVDGILYPFKTVINSGRSDALRLQILSVSHDFDDAVFNLR